MDDVTVHYGETERKRLTVRYMPLTVRNEVTLRSLAAEIDQHIGASNTETMAHRLIEASRDYPEVFDFFNEAGQWNKVAIDKMAKSLQNVHEQEHNLKVEATKEGDAAPAYEPLSYEDAVREAVKRMQAQWSDMLRGNLDLARRLYFAVGKWPVSLDGIRKGMEIVPRIIDRNAMSPHDVEAITGDSESEFWQTVSASEVARIIDTFRTGID